MNLEDIEISKIGTESISDLQKISLETFVETFAEYNSEENMKSYLDDSFDIEKLNEELINENSEFYFAKLNGKVMGYLKINFGKSQTELINAKALEIERIYVLKEYYGKNVAQLLYQKAMQIAKDQNVDFVWLGVWEHNPRAIRFYEKNGFVEFDTHIFKLGTDEQTDKMMKLDLRKN